MLAADTLSHHSLNSSSSAVIVFWWNVALDLSTAGDNLCRSLFLFSLTRCSVRVLDYSHPNSYYQRTVEDHLLWRLKECQLLEIGRITGTCRSLCTLALLRRRSKKLKATKTTHLLTTMLLVQTILSELKTPTMKHVRRKIAAATRVSLSVQLATGPIPSCFLL